MNVDIELPRIQVDPQDKNRMLIVWEQATKSGIYASLNRRRRDRSTAHDDKLLASRSPAK
jgi:hypothetical protein